MVMMRKPCPFEKFLNDFECVNTPDQARFIERTRYCIASLGKVSATQIYSDDSLQDTIGYLPFWHSFEEATFLNLLESQTGVSFTEDSIQNVANPDVDLAPNDMTIKQFIMELFDAAEKSGGFGS